MSKVNYVPVLKRKSPGARLLIRFNLLFGENETGGWNHFTRSICWYDHNRSSNKAFTSSASFMCV